MSAVESAAMQGRPFFERLRDETEASRQTMLGAPVIQRALSGDISRDEYVAFLYQAYHHVRQTVPLLMAVGARLPAEQEWLREAVAEYIEEELGHQEWVLDDIRHCGFDAEMVRHGQPALQTELMVAYAWDTVQRISPLGFFGMVHVLEGTSIALADRVADQIETACGLPGEAFRYLRSHGALDQSHVQFFRNLMNRIDDPDDQALIIHYCHRFYHLYGDIFRHLNPDHGLLPLEESAHADH